MCLLVHYIPSFPSPHFVVSQLETDDVDGMDVNSPLNSAIRRASVDSHAAGEFSSNFGPAPQIGRHLLRPIKSEEEDLSDEGSTFSLFASLLDSALQGLCSLMRIIMSPCSSNPRTIATFTIYFYVGFIASKN